MKLFIYPIILVSFLYGGNKDLIKEYKEMFEKISQQRVGLDESEIERVKSPFVKTGKVKEEKKADKLQLEAIFGQKVLINGKWYKLYSKVGKAKIVAIRNDTVILKDDETIKKLKLRTKNDFISIK